MAATFLPRQKPESARCVNNLHMKFRGDITLKSRSIFVSIFCIVSLLFSGGRISHADVTTIDPAAIKQNTIADASSVEESEYADLDEIYPVVVGEEAHSLSEVSLWTGYRFFSTEQYGGRAATYEDIHSGMTGGASIISLGKDNKLLVDGLLNSENDYKGDFTYDNRGIYRLHLRTESLFHNLGHERLFLPNGAGPVLFRVNYFADDKDPAAFYGLRVEQDLAEFRYKTPSHPFHVNFAYWRMAKDGRLQLRFADHAFETPAGEPNAIYSDTRHINRQIHEGRVGLDTNIGPVDLVYQFTVRQFNDSIGTPVDFFVERLSDPRLAMQRISGDQQHNEDPESRYMSHSVKLHTSIAGGLVGAASYTYGQRENLSRLTDIGGANRTRNYLNNVAADLFYTPFQQLAFALKYRRQEVTRSGSATITANFGIPSILEVRPAINTEKNMITATVSYRPVSILTIKGEFRGEFLKRDNLDSWNRPGVVESFNMADDYDQYKGIVTVLGRPAKSLRLKAQYSYTAANRPDYGTTPLERHEGQLFATYTLAKNWGLTASYEIIREWNSRLSMDTLNLTPPSVTYQLPRQRQVNNAIASLWFAPTEQISLSGSYGILRNAADQSIIFSGPLVGSNAASRYTGQSQLAALNAAYRLNETLDTSVSLQRIRSYSHFKPGTRAGLDTGGITEISRVDTIENSISSRTDFRFAKNLVLSLSYSYRDYRDKVQAYFSGTVHAISTSLAGNW